MKPNVNAAAIYEWLARTSVAQIRAQMADPPSLVREVSELYQDPESMEDQPENNPPLDSPEAAELATFDDDQMEAYSRRWGSLTDEERKTLREMFSSLFESNPEYLAMWIEDLDLNMPIPQDDGDEIAMFA